MDSISEFIYLFNSKVRDIRLRHELRSRGSSFSVFNYVLVKAECEAINVSLYNLYICYRRDMPAYRKDSLHKNMAKVWFGKYRFPDDNPYQLGSVTKTIRGE